MRRSQAKQQEAARRAWAGGQEGKRKRYRGGGGMLTRMTLSVGQGPSHQWPVGLSSFGVGGVILSAGKAGGGGMGPLWPYGAVYSQGLIAPYVYICVG